jgi:hypothetical protein
MLSFETKEIVAGPSTATKKIIKLLETIFAENTFLGLKRHVCPLDDCSASVMGFMSTKCELIDYFYQLEYCTLWFMNTVGVCLAHCKHNPHFALLFRTRPAPSLRDINSLLFLIQMYK